MRIKDFYSGVNTKKKQDGRSQNNSCQDAVTGGENNPDEVRSLPYQMRRTLGQPLPVVSFGQA